MCGIFGRIMEPVNVLLVSQNASSLTSHLPV